MGFNLKNYGTVQPCGIDEGCVYRELPSGKLVGYPCSLEVRLPKQLNLFSGPTVAFLLEDAEKEYIGRWDGSISIIRKKDGLLYGLSMWEPPKHIDLTRCGYINYGAAKRLLYLDECDRQSLYVADYPLSASLVTPCYEDFEFQETASLLSSFIDDDFNLHILKEGGVALASTGLCVQESVRRFDCRMFI